MLKVLLYATPLILAIYAMVDLVQTKDEDIQGLPKLAWVALIVVFWVIGPIAWLLAGHERSLPPGRWNPKRPITGPRGPEDDPDFLRSL